MDRGRAHPDRAAESGAGAGPGGRGGRLRAGRTRDRLLRVWLLRVWAVATAVGWLLAALLIIVPAPTELLLYAGAAATETSLIITVGAALGLGPAALARRAGLVITARLAAAGLGAALALSLLPLGAGLSTAAEHGVAVSLSRYLPRPGAGTPAETVRYRSGTEAEAPRLLDVWRPDPGRGGTREPRPAVVLVHGGGWDQGSRGGSALADRLADRGYVVFDIDYRLATDTRPSWRQATADVRCAVGWVATRAARYDVDPDRIGLLGWSAGGHLALLAAYARDEPALAAPCPGGSHPVATVAALYPVTDLAALAATPRPWWLRSPDVRALAARFLGGSPAAVPDRYRLASPINHLGPAAPPTFLAHGTRDRVVPIEQSRALARRLQHRGVPHQLVELPGSDHGFDLFGGGWNTQTALTTLDRFLDDRLGPAPP